jgi:5-methylcytosine-specific restriction endonuclease McrA
VALTGWIRKHQIALPAEFLDDKGAIKRASMPKWVRDAVFFRDHGRCVFCHANLSGLLSLDRLDPFDHIVPLAKGGINDPTNVQLLCETCNLKKSDCDARTGLRYPAWWPE